MFPLVVPFLATSSKPTSSQAYSSPATSLHSGNGKALGSKKPLLPDLSAAETLLGESQL